MSWDDSLSDQILAEFRDAQRRRGEINTSDERPRVLLEASLADQQQARTKRRIVRRTG